MARREFLDGKLIIIGEEHLHEPRDVLVNFCTPNIFSGGDLLREIHELAGSSLENECRQYCGLGSGCCRLTDSYEAKQFKKIAHCILPAPKSSDKPFSEIEYFDFSIAYRNALDLTAEGGFKTIAFTHPYFYAHKVIATIAILTIKRWLNCSPYADQIEQIIIMCGPEDLFQLYTEIGLSSTEELDDILNEVFSDSIKHSKVPDFLNNVNIKLFKTLMQSPEFDASFDNPIYYNGSHYPTTSQYCMERYGFDEAFIHEHSEQLYDELFKTPDGLQLQLSRNLSATILTIEEESGLLRQYRMTTQNREGETCYFRCSRCESLMKHTNSDYRPKITVKNGYIYGNCYPEHHPECYPATKEAVIIQQMDREARMSLLRPTLDQSFNSFSQSKHEFYPNDSVDSAAGEFSDARFQSNGKTNGFVKNNLLFTDEEVNFNQLNRPIFRPVLGSTSVNNTLEAIRKCENELDEDYNGLNETRIRDEDFTRIMVGDLQPNNIVQTELIDKVINENDSNKMLLTSEALNKIVENESSEPDVILNEADTSNEIKLSKNIQTTNDSQQKQTSQQQQHLEEITEEEFPLNQHSKIINLSSSSIAFKSFPENDIRFIDNVEPEIAEEQHLITKCRKYRIIRERRRNLESFKF